MDQSHISPCDTEFRGKLFDVPNGYDVPFPITFFQELLTEDMISLFVEMSSYWPVEKTNQEHLSTFNPTRLTSWLECFTKWGLQKCKCCWEVGHKVQSFCSSDEQKWRSNKFYGQCTLLKIIMSQMNRRNTQYGR